MASEEKIRKKIKKKLRIDNKRLKNSFKYASEGIIKAYEGEQNLEVHTFVAILVIVFGFFLKLSSAIEYVVDLASTKIHPLAKSSIDIAAAGVLMISIISAITGLMIFVPKLIDFFNKQ